MSRRRLLTVLIAVTVLFVVLDLVRAPGPSQIRRVGASVVGPVLRVLDGGSPTLDEVRADRDRLATELAGARRSLAELDEVRALLGSPSANDATIVSARVVAVDGRAGTRPERITVDVGSRDGVTTDLTVITADGLVGRTVAVAPWTSDVVVIGAADVVVGVRAGPKGTLGSLAAAPVPAGATRSAGEVTLTLVELGEVRVGDGVTTLGSVDSRPFIAGIPVGTVTSVDPRRGQVGVTAAVRPAVDVATLDVVGIVLAPPREYPRPTTKPAP